MPEESQNKEDQQQIKMLLEKNLEMTEEILKMTKKIKGYVTFQKVMSYIYFLLIVGPIVLGIIYLPPLLNNIMSQYNKLLGEATGNNGAQLNINELLKGGLGGANLNGVDINKILNQFKKSPTK